MQQRHAGPEPGVEHDGAIDMADGPVGGALEHLHHAVEVQQHPHHQPGSDYRHASPAVRPVSQHHRRNAGDRNKYSLEVHGAILAAAARKRPTPRPTPLAENRVLAFLQAISASCPYGTAVLRYYLY